MIHESSKWAGRHANATRPVTDPRTNLEPSTVMLTDHACVSNLDLTTFCAPSRNNPDSCERACRCDLARPDSITDYCWPCFRRFVKAAKAGDIEPSLIATLDDESREVLRDACFDIRPFGPWFLPSAAQLADLRVDGLVPMPHVAGPARDADLFGLHDVELDRLGRTDRKGVAP
jgi:hypothetical protein